jgi:hypothetical protein
VSAEVRRSILLRIGGTCKSVSTDLTISQKIMTYISLTTPIIQQASSLYSPPSLFITKTTSRWTYGTLPFSPQQEQNNRLSTLQPPISKHILHRRTAVLSDCKYTLFSCLYFATMLNSGVKVCQVGWFGALMSVCGLIGGWVGLKDG